MSAPTIVTLAPLAEALEQIAAHLSSPQVVDNGGLEAANLVDTTQRIAEAGYAIAEAIDRLATALAPPT